MLYSEVVFYCFAIFYATCLVCIACYAYESGFAPEGKSVINSFISQYDRDYEWWEKLYQDKEAYETCKQKLAQDILQRMEQHFPELAGKLSVIDVYTPVTYHNYCNAYHGAWHRNNKRYHTLYIPLRQSHKWYIRTKSQMIQSVSKKV